MASERMAVLITGAGSGIGRAVSLAMAAAGHNIACADIDPETAQATATEAAASGIEAVAIEADTGDTGAIDRMVTETVARFGRLDVLVNNAGITRIIPMMEVREADWDSMHRVNARGVFFCLQRAARQMIAQGGGRIINIASVAGRAFRGTSNIAYAASKGAVITMTWSASQQLGPHNITVNAICPGVTRTPLVQGLAEQQASRRNVDTATVLAEMAQHSALGRLNEPEDMAALAVFLASPGAANITGQAWNVDAGIMNS